ncbi:uncharacterized protein [Takifugu rubripes]|uniref:uncharacterized protein n=1 Tax=Takifugu rubripes TaxID=31033 RepID=UPI001145E013|nr:uncharacterized protein LOC115250843 [Takifugu rubripes]
MDQPASHYIQAEGSVMLNCTVHTGWTCDGDHAVYWFRNSGPSQLGLMYSHTGRNKQCERKTNTCFYSFSMKNLNTSQTGTYIDIERYASSVLDYISTSIDSVTTQKQITMYPNQKPWMNRDVRLLLKARNITFRSGDAQTYSTARANLKRGIKKAKHDYKLKVEGHFSNSNPRSMWQGIQVISNYNPINPSPPQPTSPSSMS